MIVLYLFGILVNIKLIRVRDNPCKCSGIGKMPLPCVKDVWEADTRPALEAAYDLNAKFRKNLLYEDLMQSLNQKDASTESICIDELSEWCANLDGLGSLVYIVALAR